MKTKEEIGLYLKTLREENEATQAALATTLMVEPQTISKWETGNGMPDISLLEKISNHYNITVDDILNCHFNPNRYTLKTRKQLINNDLALLNSLFKDSDDKVFKNSTYRDIEYYGFMSLEDHVWKFNLEDLNFYHPKANIPYDDCFMRDILLYSESWGEFTNFMLKVFKLSYSKEMINYLNRNNLLEKYFISYIGPINELYPEEESKHPELVNIEYQLHPNIAELRASFNESHSRTEFLAGKQALLNKAGLERRISLSIANANFTRIRDAKECCEYISSVINLLEYKEAPEILSRFIERYEAYNNSLDIDLNLDEVEKAYRTYLAKYIKNNDYALVSRLYDEYR